eukprot:365486-Chlamydomonas_euryale.AAC.1
MCCAHGGGVDSDTGRGLADALGVSVDWVLQGVSVDWVLQGVSVDWVLQGVSVDWVLQGVSVDWVVQRQVGRREGMLAALKSIIIIS